MAPAWKSEFLQFCIDSDVLRFGDFTLKSGRSSPYFFNAGLFNSGRRIAQLGKYYAAAITEAGLEYDVIFGPAYKGIPLATTTVAALADRHGLDVPFSYNRKEVKDHGEGGTIVGAPLVGRVLIIDDVITAGTAARESAAVIHAAGAQVAGLIIALDRQEKGMDTELSAVQQLEQNLKMTVVPIATLTDMIEFLETSQPEQATRLRAHKQAHGVA